MNMFCKYMAIISGKKKTGIDSNSLKNSGERANTNVYWCKRIKMFPVL